MIIYNNDIFYSYMLYCIKNSCRAGLGGSFDFFRDCLKDCTINKLMYCSLLRDPKSERLDRARRG